LVIFFTLVKRRVQRCFRSKGGLCIENRSVGNTMNGTLCSFFFPFSKTVSCSDASNLALKLMNFLLNELTARQSQINRALHWKQGLIKSRKITLIQLRALGSLRLLSALAVKSLYFFLLVDTVLEALELGELGHSALIDVINTFKCFVANGFLIVSQYKASEFTSPEKVPALVFRLRQGENNFARVVVLWFSLRTEFKLELLVVYLEFVRIGRPQGCHLWWDRVFEWGCFDFNRTKLIRKFLLTLALNHLSWVCIWKRFHIILRRKMIVYCIFLPQRAKSHATILLQHHLLVMSWLKLLS